MSEPTSKADSEPLNESWVELHFGHQSTNGSTAGSSTNGKLQSTHDGLEKLLVEAQRESNSSVYTGSSGPHSPQSQHSPPLIGGPVSQLPDPKSSDDWIWEWSSRPEPRQDQNTQRGMKFKHPYSSVSTLPPAMQLPTEQKTKQMERDIFHAKLVSGLAMSHLSILCAGIALGYWLGSKSKGLD